MSSNRCGSPSQGGKTLPRPLLRHLSLALLPLATVVALIQPLGGEASTRQGPSVSANSLVDLDHNRQFPQNTQNEPAITPDPPTGVLVAGANDELDHPLFKGTTPALTSPCPFAPS